jgi:hypothetical protein
MERSSKRGKIPQSDWPSIMARYEAGETLSSIARTYDCSPPAISYVVSRSRARQPAPAQPVSEAPRPPAVGEPQLIKASAVASSVNGGGDHAIHREPAMPPPSDVPPAQKSWHADHGSDSRPAHEGGNGFERAPWATREPNAADLFAPNRAPVAPRASEPSPQHTAPSQPTAPPQHTAPHGTTNGDPRSRLHLHLGDASHANGAAAASDPRQPDQPQAPAPQRQPQPQALNGGGYRPAWASAAPSHEPAPPNHHPAPQYTNGGHSGNGGRQDSHGETRKENGAFIDRELRARVEADITAFLTAFDAALAEDTPDSRVGLREATDRLLRAGARTRIELERLEARMPLPPRDGTRPAEPAWRQR